MNSLDYFNSQTFSNDLINTGGIKENNTLDSALSIKNNTPIDTLLNYIEKDKPEDSEITTVSDEELDLTKSLLQEKPPSSSGNTSSINTIFIIVFVIIILLIIISIVLYFILRNKQNIKDKMQHLSKAINETYNNSSKNTNLSNSILENESY